MTTQINSNKKSMIYILLTVQETVDLARKTGKA